MKILQVFNQYRFRGGEEAWVDTIPHIMGVSAVVEELRFQSNDWVGPTRPSLLQQARWIGLGCILACLPHQMGLHERTIPVPHQG